MAMSDVLKTLIQNYYTSVTTEMEDGGRLDYIRACYLLHPNDTIYLDWSSPSPFLLIYINDYVPIPDSFGCLRSDLKEYSVGLSYFVEFQDENLGYLGDDDYDWKGIIDASDDLYDLYNRNTFSDASIEAICTNVSYQRHGSPPLSGYHQCHLTFQHRHLDRRAAL
jgi:hypothetical protein